MWVDNGGGFNAYPAGLSVATAKKVSREMWAEHERWTREMRPVVENMRVQRERAEEWVAALEWEEKEGEDGGEAMEMDVGGDCI